MLRHLGAAALALACLAASGAAAHAGLLDNLLTRYAAASTSRACLTPATRTPTRHARRHASRRYAWRH